MGLRRMQAWDESYLQLRPLEALEGLGLLVWFFIFFFWAGGGGRGCFGFGVLPLLGQSHFSLGVGWGGGAVVRSKGFDLEGVAEGLGPSTGLKLQTERVKVGDL